MAQFRRLLLLSNSTQHGCKYLEHASEIVKNFFEKYGVNKVLFIPYACFDHDAYFNKVKPAFLALGLQIESIHQKPKAVDAILEAQGIFIGGGNTFLLLKTLYENSLIEPIRKKVLEDGMPYMGASAGTNVSTISICTTNDMPIVYPPSFKALGLVPFNINPHYIDPDANSKHMGETREDRIREYHQVTGTPAVLGLREGCILSIENDKATLLGLTGAKLFARGKPPEVYDVGSDMSFLLQSS